MVQIALPFQILQPCGLWFDTLGSFDFLPPSDNFFMRLWNYKFSFSYLVIHKSFQNNFPKNVVRVF